MVELFLCSIRLHDIKTFSGVEIQLQTLLISTLDADEWSASRSDRFTVGGRAPGVHWIGGWVDTGVSLDATPLPRIEFRFLGCPARSPVTILTELSGPWVVYHILYKWWVYCSGPLGWVSNRNSFSRNCRINWSFPNNKEDLNFLWSSIYFGEPTNCCIIFYQISLYFTPIFSFMQV
jgi:hypothetical protein